MLSWQSASRIHSIPLFQYTLMNVFGMETSHNESNLRTQHISETVLIIFIGFAKDPNCRFENTVLLTPQSMPDIEKGIRPYAGKRVWQLHSPCTDSESNSVSNTYSLYTPKSDWLIQGQYVCKFSIRWMETECNLYENELARRLSLCGIHQVAITDHEALWRDYVFLGCRLCLLAS